MKSYSLQLILLLKRLLLLLLIYQLSRIAFFISNYSYFQSAGLLQILNSFIAGTRFDISVIFILNIFFILIHFIPAKWFFNHATQTILKFLFIIVNIPAILLNSIDMEYFKFQGKRTTADLFQLFGFGEDMKNTIPQMAKDFWYVILLFLILSAIAIVFYNHIKVRKTTLNAAGRLGWKAVLILFPCLLLLFLGARGGMQYKPLNIMAAARFTTPQLVPLVLNTPFTVMKTLGKELVEEKNYMPAGEALKYFNKVHQYKKPGTFKKMNVVILIMESFSSEYIGALNNGDGYTPFLDSLMHESLVFSNAYANAKKSIDGIPAIIAGIPTLMSSSYISSPYNSNKLRSIAGILKSKNYSSAFFHGGNNGTMGFDNFTLLTGFEKYYGRKEYPGNEYDGQWGIFDENFFYFFINKCNSMNTPFVNVFFSLSSHHPYTLPSHLKNKFKKGPLPIHESIGYADYSLSCFFREAKKQSWFNNTLFVITADHTGPSVKPYYQTKAGMFRIPLIFYCPSLNLKGDNPGVTQQVSIVPGILDLLGYSEPFVSFGNSMFDSTHAFAINYTGDMYQLADNEQLLQFDGNDAAGLYNYKVDSFLFNNIKNPKDPKQQKLTLMIESVLQQFNSSLIKNELVPPVR
jgi:phosphoglycerol transferase MdoB-like AlkP superfamily enzyme